MADTATLNVRMDAAAAVERVAEALGSPKAAEDLLAGIVDALESRRAVLRAAASYEGLTGSTRYIASCRRFDIHCVIEEGPSRPSA